VGEHAKAINKLRENSEGILRERMGHSKVEILGGILIGGGVALSISYILGELG
jgi:acid phosphatase family membrane protein YuiD